MNRSQVETENRACLSRSETAPPQAVMRCRFRLRNRFPSENVTVRFVTRCRATPHHRLRAELSRCGSVRRGSRSPPETDSLPRPCFAALKGEAKEESCRAGRKTNDFSPEDRNFLRCAQHLCRCRHRSHPFPGGVSGGGAALSSLCRRFPGGDIMNLTSRRNPLSGLSFSLFFFLRERKRGYWRRRSREISVAKAKPDNLSNQLFLFTRQITT